MDDRCRFTMLVGIPGSGKSTYCKQHIESYVISLDRLIEGTMLPGETYLQAFQRHTQSGGLKILDRIMYTTGGIMAYTMPEIDKVKRFPIIWDQTNLTVKTRAKKLNLFNPEYWRRKAVVFELSDEEWQKRYDHRAATEGKTIPQFVLDGMRSSYQAPTLAEGFDEVEVVGHKNALFGDENGR